MSIIGIELHIFRQNFSSVETFRESFKHESMLVDRGSESPHSIKFFLEKCALHLDPQCANENLQLSGPVSCRPQFIDVKNLSFFKLGSEDWIKSVSSFARHNSEHCSHGNKFSPVS